MKGLIVLLIALCAAVAHTLPTADTNTTSACVPGETKNEDCNECICRADGSGYQCTERDCTNTHVEAKDGHARVCEPGSVKKEDCNTCTCTPDGMNYMCTLMLCHGHNLQKRESEPDRCKPGTSKIIDCNICNCAAVGVWACTLKSCDGGDDTAILRSRREAETVKEVTTDSLATTPCTPGEKTKLDCNTCTCAADGSGYACTRQICNFQVHDRRRRAAETEEVKEVTAESLATTPCTPGEKTKLDCNTCTCARDGTGYACTRQACHVATHDRKRRSAETEEVKEVTTDTLATTPCTPGEKTNIDCNSCTCAADGSGYACTRRRCLVGSHERKRRSDNAQGKECEPGETKQIDCNTCRCSSNGQFACTFKLCLPPVNGQTLETRTKREEPECTTGEVKQVDCNTCRCANGVFACTRKMCVPGLEDRTKRQAGTCVPGSTKKEDCNTCTCNEKGTGYRCTLLACGNEQIRNKRDSPTNLPSTRCTPNSVFNRDCNTCRCNAQGTFAACTFKLCIPGH